MTMLEDDPHADTIWEIPPETLVAPMWEILEYFLECEYLTGSSRIWAGLLIQELENGNW